MQKTIISVPIFSVYILIDFMCHTVVRSQMIFALKQMQKHTAKQYMGRKSKWDFSISSSPQITRNPVEEEAERA